MQLLVRRSVLICALLVVAGTVAAQVLPSQRWIAAQSNVTLNCPLGIAAGTGDDSLVCSTGETLTFARASAGYACPTTASENTAVTTGLATNAPCYIDGYGISVNYAVTNKVFRSESFDNASWVAVQTPTITADSTLAPDGSTTADTIQDNDATNTEGVQLTYVTGAAIATGVQMSVWAQTSSGSQTFRICEVSTVDTCNGTEGCCCTNTATTTWQRFRCNVSAIATSQDHKMRIALGQLATDTGTAIFWGASAITPKGNVADPYCPSTGASATTCAAENLDLLTTGASPAQEFESVSAGGIEVGVRPFWRALGSATTSDGTTGNNPFFFQAASSLNVNEHSCFMTPSALECFYCGSGGACTLVNGTTTAATFAVGTLNTVFYTWGPSTHSYGRNAAVDQRDTTGTNNPSGGPVTVRIGARGTNSDAYLGACFSNVKIYRPAPSGYR